MQIAEQIIEIIFSLALFINALIFVPQIVRLYKDKSSKGVSILTFGGFWLIQLTIILHGLINHDKLLVIGYLFSIVTCGTVIILILRYRKKDTKTAEITADEILAQIPEHVYWKDKNLRMLGCNTNTWRNFGLASLADYQGKTDYEIFPKEQADHLRAVDLEVLTTGKSVIMEESGDVVHGDTAIYLSHKVPLKHNDETIGILGISVDITEARRATEAHLKMLGDIITATPVNIYWMGIDGRYLGCNDQQAALIGLKSPKDIIGKRNIDMPGFLIAEALDPINNQVMRTGEQIVTEDPAVLPDGAKATFLSTKSPLFDKKGKIIGLVGVSVDITDRKEKQRLALENEARKALMEVQDQLAHLARIDSMGALAVGIAHEINQPLSAISNYVNGIKRRLQNISEDRLPEGILPAMDSIATQAKRAGEIIHTLKDFLRKGDSEKQALDINQLINNVLVLLKMRIMQQKVQIQLRLNNALPHITVNKVQIEQVVFNLMNNALDALADNKVGGQITIRTQCYKKDYIRITVVDNGVGMTHEQLQKLFTPFTTTKENGMGVGLTLCLNIIERHLGHIFAVSRPRKGTIFHVILPIKSMLIRPDSIVKH